MKKFLLYLFIFSSAILLTLGIGELIVHNIPNPYSVKNSYAISSPGKDLNTLILGSSHTYFGIIADSLGPATLNLANVSQNYEYDYRLLHHYYPSMPHLKRVIIPVSHFSFFDPPFEKGPEKWNEIFYRIYMGIDKYPILSPYSFEISNLPVYTGKLKTLFSTRRHALSSPQGFGLDYKLSDRDPDWMATAAEHAGYHNTPDFSYEEYNIEWFDSLLNFCYNRKIEIFLISTPTHSTYRNLLDPAQKKRTKQLTDSIARPYGLRLIDFTANPNFYDDDFYDADHLSDQGALKFTRILRDSLLHRTPIKNSHGIQNVINTKQSENIKSSL